MISQKKNFVKSFYKKTEKFFSASEAGTIKKGMGRL